MAEQHGRQQRAVGIRLLKLLAGIVRFLELTGQVIGRGQPLQGLLDPQRLGTLADGQLIRGCRLLELPSRLLSIGAGQQPIGPPQLGAGIGLGQRSGLVGRQTVVLRRRDHRLLIGLSVGRICRARLRLGDPAAGLIAQLRMVLERIEHLERLGVLLELHLAEAQSKLRLRHQRRVGVLRGECLQPLGGLGEASLFVHQHAAIEPGPRDVVRRRVLHERLQPLPLVKNPPPDSSRSWFYGGVLMYEEESAEATERLKAFATQHAKLAARE